MHAANAARHAAGPNLVFTALLLTAAYLADLALTVAGHQFLSTTAGFRELNPVVAGAANAGAWALPAALKALGTALLWAGVFILRRTPWEGRYAWLLGGFAVFYTLLDAYQLTLIFGADAT